MLINAKPRLNQESLTSFVLQWMGSTTGPHSTSTRTLQLGELKPLTTEYIVDMDMSGRDWTLLTYRNDSLTLYIRFYWGPTNKTWDLWGAGCKDNGAKARYYLSASVICRTDQFTPQVKFCNMTPTSTWQAWRLIPIKVEGVPTPSQSLSEVLGSGPPPLYDGDTAAGQSSARSQHVESERDDFGTIVTEVNIVTTRKRYRVADA